MLIASMNYLGLGLAPPAADWGLMISENQQYISLNSWSVLAPAIMLALLTICVNLIADAYVQTLGRRICRPAEPALGAVGRRIRPLPRDRADRLRGRGTTASLVASEPRPLGRGGRASRRDGVGRADRRGRVVLARRRRGPRRGRRDRLGQDDDARWRCSATASRGARSPTARVASATSQMTTASGRDQRRLRGQVV